MAKIFAAKIEKKLRQIDSDTTKKETMADEAQNVMEVNQNGSGSNSK